MRIISRYIITSLIVGLSFGHAPAIAAEAEGRRIDVGGHRLYVNCSGSGSPTVIIDAGMGGFSLEWQPVQARLNDQIRVCSYDRAGYGRSDSGPLPRTSARIADELHALLKNAEIPGPYLLVGHSFGGYNMRHFAHSYPDDIVGLVLIDASHPEQFERFPGRNLAGETNIPATDGGGNRKLVSRPVLAANYPRELRRQALVLMSTRKARRAQAEEFRGFMTSAAEVRDLALPDIPILVLSRGRQAWPDTVHGHNMERIWTELQAELGRLSPRTLHLVAADSGHLVHFDQPAAVSSAVLLTATAARSRWPDWDLIASGDGNLIAPILDQSTRLARR